YYIALETRSKTLDSTMHMELQIGFARKLFLLVDAGITAMETLNHNNESDESDLDISQENDLSFDISTVQDIVVRKR
ncbi:38840_t:CDS:2, partial [Gigaspora margarita]